MSFAQRKLLWIFGNKLCSSVQSPKYDVSSFHLNFGCIIQKSNKWWKRHIDITIVPITVCPGLVERTHLDVNGNQAEAEQEADPAYPSSLLERRLQEEFGGHRRMAWKSRKTVSFS